LSGSEQPLCRKATFEFQKLVGFRTMPFEERYSPTARHAESPIVLSNDAGTLSADAATAPITALTSVLGDFNSWKAGATARE
jgi:hypothetical protein